MLRILSLIILLAASLCLVNGQGAFKPRDANEDAAWQTYQQYKASKAKEAALNGKISEAKKDLKDASHSSIGALGGILTGDSAYLADLRRQLNAEIEKQNKLLAVWNRRFRARYGELSDISQTIDDPKTRTTMDRIEFRIRYFAFDQKAALDPSDDGGPAKIAGGWSLTGENLWSENPNLDQYIREYAAGAYKVRGSISSGSSIHSWINPNREGAPKTSLAVEWNAPSGKIDPGTELVITANATDNGSSAGAAEGDFVSFNVSVWATKDEKTWVAVSGGGRDLYASPRKSETRDYRFNLPNEQYIKLVIRIRTGSGFWAKNYDYIYEWNSFDEPADEPDNLPVRTIASGILNSRAINLPDAEYPAAAKPVGAAGSVSVRVIVDKTGKVIEAEAVSGHPLLRAAAQKAAILAEFAPPTLNGKPVRLSGTLNYDFKPN